MKNNIIIGFGTILANKEGIFYCVASCDGIQIGSGKGTSSKEAMKDAYDKLCGEGKVEDGTTCVFYSQSDTFTLTATHSKESPIIL